jgi:carbon monoxide dehydrogenase subunit G
MRFNGVRDVPARVEDVWPALHDPAVLRAAIPGCERLEPVGRGRFAATLAARVGRVADTYRGTFTIEDVRAGSELAVLVRSRGRFGTLDLELRVRLEPGHGTSTVLTYDAYAVVGGLVSRLGRAPLTVAGGHITSCFFRDLARAVRRPAARPAPTRDRPRLVPVG